MHQKYGNKYDTDDFGYYLDETIDFNTDIPDDAPIGFIRLRFGSQQVSPGVNIPVLENPPKVTFRGVQATLIAPTP